MKLKLVETKSEVDDIITYIFDPMQPLSWQPGQFLHYLLPHPNADDRHADRWFTIAAAPFEKQVKVTARFPKKMSSFKRAFMALPIGAEIDTDGPEGEFVITDPDRALIFVAGGIGITPFRSILAEADHNGIKLKAHLLYHSNDSAILFQEELQGYAQHNPELQIDFIADPQRIDERRLQQAIEQADNPYMYLSGPEPMVEAFAVMAKKLGVSGDHIQTDFFTGYG